MGSDLESEPSASGDSLFGALTRNRALVFGAPIAFVAIEIVLLSIAVRRSHWEIFEIAPAAIVVSGALAIACSLRLAWLGPTADAPVSAGLRAAIFVGSLIGQVVLSCLVASVLFSG